jgi:hypothetical protein
MANFFPFIFIRLVGLVNDKIKYSNDAKIKVD